jgi:hypothetical protein
LSNYRRKVKSANTSGKRRTNIEEDMEESGEREQQQQQ